MQKKQPKNQEGQIIIVALVFFAIVILLSSAILVSISTYLKNERQTVARNQALHLAEAGIDQAAYQLNQNVSYSGETDTALGNGSFTVSVSDIDSENKRVTSTGRVTYSGQTAARTVKATFSIDHDVISFRYGVQAGNGGFSLANSSTVTGNIFSTGSVIGSGDNYIYGDIVSAGPGGLVYGIHSTGSVFSHTIGDSKTSTIIDKDAYYQAISNTSVGGVEHPGNPDQAPVPLPISDEQINEWEEHAASGGTISACDGDGNYVIVGTVSLGPKKINCNLIVKDNSGVLNVTGPLWIAGNIDVRIGSTVKVDAALEEENVAVIADNPADRSGSGIITIGQSSLFEGSGVPGSFVFLISQNNSAETGGSTVAVDQRQGAAALVAYASHGLISMGQSANVKEVTAYKIALSQSANVTYDSGLPSTLFESGPGASWTYERGSYVIQK